MRRARSAVATTRQVLPVCLNVIRSCGIAIVSASAASGSRALKPPANADPSTATVPVGVAVGAEYRAETNAFHEDPDVEAGYTFYNSIPEFTAPAFEVKMFGRSPTPSMVRPLVR